MLHLLIIPNSWHSSKRKYWTCVRPDIPIWSYLWAPVSNLLFVPLSWGKWPFVFVYMFDAKTRMNLKWIFALSLCRGVCLHKYLHTDSYPKPNIDWTINIAIQIAQGMAYLHNKQMIHKDLRSKNIFIEGNKAVITDFGLYAITRLCKKNLKYLSGFIISIGFLEFIRSLFKWFLKSIFLSGTDFCQ